MTGVTLSGYAQCVPMKPETAVRRASERFDAATAAVVEALNQLAAAQAKFEAAGQDYTAAVEQLADPWARLDAANAASEKAVKARSQFLTERNRAVADIWETSEMSLAQLSERLGVNRQWVHRMAKAGREASSGEGEPSS